MEVTCFQGAQRIERKATKRIGRPSGSKADDIQSSTESTVVRLVCMSFIVQGFDKQQSH